MKNSKVLKFLKRFYKGNPPAILGSLIVASIILLSLGAPVIAENDPNKRVARGHQPPSAELLMGSTRSGKDVFSQVLHGGRVSLLVAFTAAIITTVIAIAVGVSAGYFGAGRRIPDVNDKHRAGIPAIATAHHFGGLCGASGPIDDCIDYRPIVMGVGRTRNPKSNARRTPQRICIVG